MAASWLFFLALILGVIFCAVFIVLLVLFIKDRTRTTVTKKDIALFFVFVTCQGLLTIASSYGASLWGGWSLNVGEHFGLIIGSYLFGSGFLLLFGTFALHYYKSTLPRNLNKVIRILLFISIPLFILGFIAMTDGMAAKLYYPLPNRLSFKDGLMNASDGKAEGFVIPFYGVLLVSGAIVTYFICDHKFYRAFKKHGMLDTMFIVVFLAGVIGSRLWYCLILEPAKYLKSPVEILHIWDGGLAIQGGAMSGIIVGIIYVLIFHRKVNVRWAMDAIIPTLLIAQAIGRYGNFLNCEVHGNPVPLDNWRFLPQIVQRQLAYSSIGKAAPDGMIWQPLFFIESTINLAAYFIITEAIGRPLRKWLSLGDLACLYVIWYGIVRSILEPLRYSSGEQTFMYDQSRYTAYAMIVLGVIGIIAFHLYDFIRQKKGRPPRRSAALE